MCLVVSVGNVGVGYDKRRVNKWEVKVFFVLFFIRYWIDIF